MLRVEDRFMNKDLHRRGMTISDIARISGHDRKTIRDIMCPGGFCEGDGVASQRTASGDCTRA